MWEIPVLGDIGFFGVNGADLIRELQAVKPTQVRFTIYSPGGAVYDAIAVVGYMLEKGIESFTEIYGVCASAATVFAAHSGPKNTAIAPGSMFLVHMPYGGDQKARDNATDFCINLYTKAYGWTKAEARKHMEAENGEGVFWTAAEAKKLGVCSEVMEGAKVAAHYNLKPTAMADNKTIKVQAQVKLTTMDAARAAFSAEGTTAEVEVDIEQATADALAAKDVVIAEKEAEIAALKAENEKAVEVAQAEAITSAKQEAVTAKADLTTAESKHAKELDDLKAAHAAEIAELKKPLAQRTIADNQVPVGDEPTESDKAAARFKSTTNALEAGLTAKKEVAK